MSSCSLSDILQRHHKGIGDQSGSLSPETPLLQLAACIPEEHGYLWKWGRIYRRTIFPVWWFQECKHRTMDFMTKSTTESFLWLPNFRKSHHLSATWKMSGVRCWYCPWHDFWYLGFQGKTGGSRPPVFGFQQSFSRKIGSWGFHQIRQIVTPCHLKFNLFFFWKNGSLAGIFFQLINCGEVQVPKKNCLKHLQSLNGTMIDLLPKVLAACGQC